MKIDAPKTETNCTSKNKQTNDYLNLLQTKLKTLSINEDALIERGPTRNRDKYVDKTKPYDCHVIHNTVYTPNHLPPLYIPPKVTSDEEAVAKALTLTPEEILVIANETEFKNFVEKLCGDDSKLPRVEDTRRLSTDSSYYSDSSPMPATPEKTDECALEVKVAKKSEREKFRDSLDKNRKRARWVEVNSLDEEEVFAADESGKSRLHELLEAPPRDVREAFYANVELMRSQDGEKFLKIVHTEPSILRSCQKRFPDLVEYLIETLDTMK